jgi:hypothetical protein
MNFMFATLLGVRAAKAETGRRRSVDRLRAIHALRQPAPATDRRAPRVRAVWRINPQSGRPVMTWATDGEGDGSRSARPRHAAGRPAPTKAGSRHGRSS